jgi:hypothetical protein
MVLIKGLREGQAPTHLACGSRGEEVGMDLVTCLQRRDEGIKGLLSIAKKQKQMRIY